MSLASPVNGSFVMRAARRTSVLCAAAIALGAIALPTISRAASSPSGQPTFASVDLAKVYAGSKIKKDNDLALQAFGAKYDAALKTLQANVMLNGDDLTKLASLLVKDPVSADETKQITTYEAKAKADGDELQRLQQIPDDKQTTDDKAKLASLSSEFQAGQQALQSVQTAFQDSMQQKNDDLNAAAAAAIHAAVAKVASKQGISVVFSSQVAVYTSNDITDQVQSDMAK